MIKLASVALVVRKYKAVQCTGAVGLPGQAATRPSLSTAWLAGRSGLSPESQPFLSHTFGHLFVLQSYRAFTRQKFS